MITVDQRSTYNEMGLSFSSIDDSNYPRPPNVCFASSRNPANKFLTTLSFLCSPHPLLSSSLSLSLSVVDCGHLCCELRKMPYILMHVMTASGTVAFEAGVRVVGNFISRLV